MEFVSSRNVSHNRERPKKAWFSTNKYINLVRNLLVLKFLRQADDWI